MDVWLKYGGASTLLAILITACSSISKTTWVEYSFEEKDVAWARASGKCELKGYAYLKNRMAEIKTCAGNEVALVPASKYAIKRYKLADESGMTEVADRPNVNPPGPEYYKSIRTTTCDDAGAFEFKGLPNGDYFIVTSAIWKAPVGARRQGGFFIKKVSLRDGEASTVIVTGKPLQLAN